MADLNRDDRGQIILIAAFALAVTFVALALIVNSAIFTENLASRGETAGSDDALAMRAMVETNAGAALTAANRYNYSTDSVRDEAITFAVNNTSMQTEQQQAMTGTLVNVSYAPSESETGVRIAQNSTDAAKPTFESANVSQPFDSSANYTLARDITRSGTDGENATRAFVINATTSSIQEGNSSSFEVEVREASVLAGVNTNTWQLLIFESTSNNSIHVRTAVNEGGSYRETQCVVDPERSYIHIDVTGGTVQGEPCQALGITSGGENYQFGAGATDNYNIRFNNASQIAGNFSLVVLDPDTPDSIIANVQDGPGSNSDNPYWTDAYYEITVEYSYDTPNLRYVTDIRVAPGEPDD
ncbi:hypothetical protein [Haloarcula sp. JP-L23]|uniref:DUF7261 family protein n=1 Tax=Haloarcula sp. JP-L23 TaxID=2716717 RepID=UPI00140EB958|nr:hypothetical protein G9465_14920 [Haloarcula sp. JP-L23]